MVAMASLHLDGVVAYPHSVQFLVNEDDDGL